MQIARLQPLGEVLESGPRAGSRWPVVCAPGLNQGSPGPGCCCETTALTSHGLSDCISELQGETHLRSLFY